MKIIKIKDYYGNWQSIPVDDALYSEWHDMQQETNTLHKRTVYHEFPCDPMFFETAHREQFDDVYSYYVAKDENIRLYEAIKRLNPLQRRRIEMLMDNMSYTDIAREEGCAVSVARRSVLRALALLREFMGE